MKFLTFSTPKEIILILELPVFVRFDARGKGVVALGGGDTGNDCIGTAMRHGAKSAVSFELLPQHPACAHATILGPTSHPRVFRTDYGHAEITARFGFGA